MTKNPRDLSVHGDAIDGFCRPLQKWGRLLAEIATGTKKSNDAPLITLSKEVSQNLQASHHSNQYSVYRNYTFLPLGLSVYA